MRVCNSEFVHISTFGSRSSALSFVNPWPQVRFPPRRWRDKDTWTSPFVAKKKQRRGPCGAVGRRRLSNSLFQLQNKRTNWENLLETRIRISLSLSLWVTLRWTAEQIEDEIDNKFQFSKLRLRKYDITSWCFSSDADYASEALPIDLIYIPLLYRHHGNALVRLPETWPWNTWVSVWHFKVDKQLLTWLLFTFMTLPMFNESK